MPVVPLVGLGPLAMCKRAKQVKVMARGAIGMPVGPLVNLDVTYMLYTIIRIHDAILLFTFLFISRRPPAVGGLVSCCSLVSAPSRPRSSLYNV
jgi:hypothetical protein